MSNYTPVRLYIGQPSTSQTTLYTVPSTTSLIVKQITICNTSTSSASISLNVVPFGGSASSANLVVSNYSVQANATQSLNLSQVLSTGDVISALQGTSGAITLIISGVTIV